MNDKGITRRDFLKGAAAGAALALVPGFPSRFFSAPYIKNSKIAKKVLILGIDGMDPQILKRFVAEGAMPTFSKLMNAGLYSDLQTTLPPQSPVAWASFINGGNPGKTGIYDFVARDPATFSPYLSTSRTYPPSKEIKLGNWQLPLQGGRVDLLRKGRPFWSFLEEHGIPAVLSQLPANFPVQQSESKVLSGMGTPDLLGTYGTTTVFSELAIPGSDKFTGVRVVRIQGKEHVFETSLNGPANSFRTDKRPTKVPLTISRDPLEQIAKIDIGEEELILKVGEWSDWVPLKFELIPYAASIRGMVRIYLQSVHPYLRLCLSPINIDPSDPAVPICSPKDYSAELSEQLGRYYTQGFPDNTAALSSDIFSDEEFFTHARIVLQERRTAYDYELNNFKEGVLFFYFSSIDQCSHMLIRAMDSSHPLYPADASENVHTAIRQLYTQMDDVLRQTLDRIDNDTTLLILSDHGFAPFTRELNLSTWLVDNGFTAVKDRRKMHKTDLYEAVDWTKSKAYVLGINSIYLNLKGREKHGSLEAKHAERVKQEIIEKLLDLKDPLNGQQVVHNAYDGKKAYSGPELASAPDIVVGYNRGYRISDESALGKFPEAIISDRTNKWSADHCMDPNLVPGVLISNKGIEAKNPGLWDLAPSILQQFGIATPVEMDGKPVFKT